MNVMEDLLASAGALVKKACGYYPRATQLFVVFSSVLMMNYRGSILFEVGTGEGKSLIVSLLALVEHAIYNRSSDVITSSEILANREAIESKKFFSDVGMKVNSVHEFAMKSEVEIKQMYQEH